ncbi:DNA polymerase III subunit gamma/tau [Salinispirillum sp. LH 10-3-1]|uniref:DNA polymerase III subunit gamma/tau n=1 Tax=Salinispirillum sp. LH 10-3-1 TaxID=2952525 RepID=A0AB38YJA2_9GAMM
MSYQVLARKWRPQTFAQMVGQRHVLTALVNALDNQRLHHAYLFTGTRGVGKTTLARLFAKSLNCEVGVSSTPCGQCSACLEIAENRFIDLIEVDAASRTKVEDTRELLENVQYQPTRGRYKVYLIDEVHMLSNHSFNALLKTLEEPPPHVKFLLATTDPQKLPVTVLSRCLQFNLKSMTPDMVVDHLRDILQKESIPFEDAALVHLGKAAQGSMRDALSLTDQAVAYGQGRIQEAEVAEMLGTVDTRQILSLLEALAEQDADKILRLVAALAEFAPNWQHLMADVLTLLHQLAVLQAAPGYEVRLHQEALKAITARFAPDDIQLYYQLGLQAHKDLASAPEARQGFEMALLRMLAFTPDVKRAYRGPVPTSAAVPSASVRPAEQQGAPDEAKPEPATPAPSNPEPQVDEHSRVEALSVAPEPEVVQAAVAEPDPVVAEPEPEPAEPAPTVEQVTQDDQPPWAPESLDYSDQELPASADDEYDDINAPNAPAAHYESPVDENSDEEPAITETASLNPELASMGDLAPADESSSDGFLVFPAATQQALDRLADDVDALGDLWPDIIPALELQGVLLTLAANSVVVDLRDATLTLLVDEAYQRLYQESMLPRLIASMDSISCPIDRVVVTFGTCTGETLNQRQQRLRREAFEQAKQALQNDRFVQALQQEMGGVLLTDTIEPIVSN